MKILLTVHQFVPDYLSGTEVLTFSVAKELLRRGHKVFVLTGFPARKQMPDEMRFDSYEIEGIHVYRYHHAVQPLADQMVVTEIEYNNQLAARYFASILQDVRPDLVHFFHLSRLGAGLVDVAISRRVPAYFTPTDFWAVCPTSQLLLDDGSMCDGPSIAGGNCVKHVAELNRGGFVKKYIHLIPTPVADMAAMLAKSFLGSIYPLAREVAAMARRRPFNISRLNALEMIFSPTRLMTDTLIRNGVHSELIQQSAYGIDISGYENHVRQRDGMARTIGFIGTLYPHKGCHILIQAFKRLNIPNVRLKIYGNTSEFPEVFAKLKALAGGVDAIEFCGTFPNMQIAAVLSELDVLVVPSLWYENTPLVVYSAFAAKCPVVASDFPGMSEVVRNQENGLVFPPGDINALYDRLRLLACTPGLLTQLSAGCKPPKTTPEYVDELETAYFRGHSLNRKRLQPEDLQSIMPLDQVYDHGYLVGWAVAGFEKPAYVRVVTSDGYVGETAVFLPRPDVRDGLRAGGAKVDSVEFGFVLPIPENWQRSDATLEIHYRGGRVANTPLDRVSCGTSIQVGGDAYVGLDEEKIRSYSSLSMHKANFR